MKMQLRLVVGLCLAIAATTGVAESLNPTNKPVNPFSVTVSESWKSGRMLPTTWRLIYDKPVLESEVGLEYGTGFVWPQTLRLAVFMVNPFEGEGMFAPPAGEVDYMFGLSGKIVGGINLGTLFQYNDFGSTKGASVGVIGDNDVMRFRLRLDRPFVFDKGVHTLTPVLTYYHLEPYANRPQVRGDVISPELKYDWLPKPWVKAGANVGFLRNEGASGGIPASIVDYGVGAGIRFYPQAWFNIGMQHYTVLGSPANVVNKDFLVYTANVSVRF